jgi:hypothetical protein
MDRRSHWRNRRRSFSYSSFQKEKEKGHTDHDPTDDNHAGL